MRCDLQTHRECSCIPSGVPCKVQAPLDLGTYRGTNHPGVGQIIAKTTRDISIWLVAIFAIFIVGIIAADIGFSRVERAYEQERV